ncbi:MAG: putative rane protein [Nocardioidaceae bacterium]|jgi:hypothetical protein|nr:putative rane protein [Nocardioidaceae bacterium]
MDDQLAHGLGRIEGKLDRIDDKLDSHAVQLAQHGVRLDRVERDVGDLKADTTHSVRQGMTVRGALLVAISGAGVSTVLGLLIQLLNAR